MLRNTMLILLALALNGCCAIAQGPDFCNRMYDDLDRIDAAKESGVGVTKGIPGKEEQPDSKKPAQPEEPAREENWQRL